MAHKKAAGSAKNLRDSNPNYHWLKLNWGQFATAWNIIVRQQGQKYRSGDGTYISKDFTIHASIDWIVSFRKRAFVRFDGRKYIRTIVDVLPEGTIQDSPSTSAPKAEKKISKPKAKPISKKADESTKPAKAKVTEKAAPKKKKETQGGDDLTKIEWIGPKIAEVFTQNWIKTFADLSESKVWDLRNILSENWLSQHDPKTWKKQATLAKNDKWDELKTLQDELDWGK